MKVLAVIVLLCLGVHSIPLESPPSPPVVLSHGNQVKEPEYAMVPDAEGYMHLVDINAELSEPETFFEAERDVVFRLFTHTVSNRVVQLDNPGSLTGSSFNANHPTRFIIHGWNGDGNSGINNAIRTAYLARGDFNVFVVDWGAGANSNYVTSRNRVDAVGRALARFIIFLNDHTGMALTNVNVVGHSLGAHIAGIAGKNTLVRGGISVIVGLDAAFPLFSADRPSERLHNGDARYVESMHTNAGLLGFDTPLGDASFYPNYGRSQPGCGIDLAGNCAHSRAHQFYAESITTDRGFWARPCADFSNILNENCQAIGVETLMGGEPANVNARGIFWLRTNSNSPFAMGRI
ncbi:phospholipase A1 VesT1.02-like [Phlebotomus argentipes]|uniref:phospholipase A1 VesT1.02-like n=1 Tax=Phlebotomus argentipes TaxID=94469 RepID=UPI002892CA10|nr:phospholipase A1 VesT1.02-like [Phlebotomus argentipes]